MLVRGLTLITSILLIAAFMQGCSKQTTLNGISSQSSSGNTTDVKRIVSTGPSLNFNSQTGGQNDLALNPTTKLPGIAYYDKQAQITGGVGTANTTGVTGALKFAYQDSYGVWNVEVVDANYSSSAAACGTGGAMCVGAPNSAAGTQGKILAVAYNSSGNPAIAYSYGVSLAASGAYKSVRYAERSTSGTWTISSPFNSSTNITGPSAPLDAASTAANVDSIKAVTLNFDSSDRPHITFSLYANRPASSAVKYMSRSTGGTWTTNEIINNLVSGASTGATTLPAGAGDNQHGAAICPANDMLVGTTVRVNNNTGSTSITAGGYPFYYTCSSENSLGACTTWSAISFGEGCTGTCLPGFASTPNQQFGRTDLAILSSNVPVVALASAAGTGLQRVVIASSTLSCENAQTTAWSTPAVASGVNIGNLVQASAGVFGLRIAAGNSNSYYAAFNMGAGVIGITYYSSSITTSGLPGLISAAVVASSGIVNSVGEGIGFAYNGTGDNFYLSYASNPTAAVGILGNDVTVVQGTTAEIVSGATTSAFTQGMVDNTSVVFPTFASATPLLDAAIATNGTVGFTYYYYDYNAGSPPGGNASGKLYYGVRGGTTTAPSFGGNIVNTGMQSTSGIAALGLHPSLAYDANSNPVIAYYNGTSVPNGQNLTVAHSYNGGTTFDATVVDRATLGSTNLGQYPSVSTSGNAIGVSYYDVTNSGLKFARWTSTHGWRKYVVDGINNNLGCGNASDDAGKHSRLVFTSTGRPVIAYQSGTGLKVAYGTEALTSSTYTWTCAAVDSSASQRAEGLGLTLDSNDYIHIAHYDVTTGTVRYVYTATAAGTAVTTGGSAFTAEEIAATGNTYTTSGPYTRPQIKFSANGASNQGTRYVTFHSSTQRALVLASKAQSASSWTLEYIDQGNSGATHPWLVGQYGSLLLNSSSYPLVFYRSYENWLKYFSRESN